VLKTPENLTTHANTISEAYIDAADISYETSEGAHTPHAMHKKYGFS